MSYLTFKKVRDPGLADCSAIQITLFRGNAGRVCGWFLGPVRFTGTGIELPYLPPSEQTLGTVAIVRAIQAARAIKAPMTVVDPDDLWEPAWQS